MAIPAEFQEREYESLFIQELARFGSFTWSPGQTDEFFLGFDGASWVSPLQLMRFGFPTPGAIQNRRPRLWPFWLPDFWYGKRLHPEFVNEWRRFADDAFPRKSLNFFVQHKRPHQTTVQGVCGDHWGQAYYEFKIDRQQQTRLEELENRLSNAAVVTYSCAAFLKKADLWKHQENATLIANSNFVSVKALKGHSRYTFIEPGHTGFANVDPEEIRDKPILERIAEAYEQSEGLFSYQVRTAARAVHAIMDEEAPDGTSLYHQLLSRVADGLDVERSEDDFFYSLLQVLAFNTVNSTSWAIITKPDDKEQK